MVRMTWNMSWSAHVTFWDIRFLGYWHKNLFCMFRLMFSWRKSQRFGRNVWIQLHGVRAHETTVFIRKRRGTRSVAVQTSLNRTREQQWLTDSSTTLSIKIVFHNHWASGLFPSSGILITNKTQRFALSKGPNRVGASPPFTWGRKQIQFPKRCFLLYLEFQTINEVQNPSTSECYTPSSEPFRFYKTIFVSEIVIPLPRWRTVNLTQACSGRVGSVKASDPTVHAQRRFFLKTSWTWFRRITARLTC
jgi:hypothetical protein